MKPFKRFHSTARADTPLKRGVNEICPARWILEFAYSALTR